MKNDAERKRLPQTKQAARREWATPPARQMPLLYSDEFAPLPGGNVRAHSLYVDCS